MFDAYNKDLPQNDANYIALSPLSFIERTAQTHPQRTAIVYGSLRQTWAETFSRCRRLASALVRAGVKEGDTVAVLLPNTPPMVEVHFGVPASGAVLNTLNTRLDAETISFMLEHGDARVIIVDTEFGRLLTDALRLRKKQSSALIIQVDDPVAAQTQTLAAAISYEDFLQQGSADFAWTLPADEWNAISLNYTSGTTGDPKGVVYHHRGAALNAVSNILEWEMPKFPVYLWTVPMFHCNGWCFVWTITARAGVNVCLRRFDVPTVFAAIREHKVTHYCGAPIVHTSLINASQELKNGITHKVSAMVAGAAPPVSMIEGVEKLGFDLIHVYGLTETYGPASICEKQEAWTQLSIEERARKNGRQGVPYHLQQSLTVLDPESMKPVPADGETIGEVMFRGNIAMKGYLKNPKSTAEAFAGGWFHTGDLGVLQEDGYVKIKDRSKDIIISGGENISSLEVEDVLYKHPAVLAAAVVAKPDSKWGETPCAFLELRPGHTVTAQEIIAYCKTHLAHYKVPHYVVFCELPKTSTGKIQKFELRKRLRSTEAIDS